MQFDHELCRQACSHRWPLVACRMHRRSGKGGKQYTTTGMVDCLHYVFVVDLSIQQKVQDPALKRYCRLCDTSEATSQVNFLHPHIESTIHVCVFIYIHTYIYM